MVIPPTEGAKAAPTGAVLLRRTPRASSLSTILWASAWTLGLGVLEE